MDKSRNRALKIFFDVFNSPECQKELKESSIQGEILPEVDALIGLAQNIERTISEKKLPIPYMKFVRERFLLLKDRNNPMLKISLIKGNLSVEDFVNKDPTELAADEIKEKLKEGKDWKMRA